MADSIVCLNSRLLLEEVAVLKREYFSSYKMCAQSETDEDRERTVFVKDELEEKLKALTVLLRPAEVERVLDLRKQYQSQLKILKKFGFSDNGSGGVNLLDISGRVWPVPPFQEVLKQMAKRWEVLDMKTDQGFKKLLLVPFGMSLGSLFEMLHAYLSTPGKSSLPFDTEEGVLIDESIGDADKRDEIAYDVRRFTGSNHGGRTKREILHEQYKDRDWDMGWQISLLQEGRDGKGTRPRLLSEVDERIVGEKRPRKDVFPNSITLEGIEEFIASMHNPDSPYYGESGMTPEEWIMTFVTHLEETGMPLDDSYTGRVCTLIGALWTKRGSIMDLNWNPDLEGINIITNPTTMDLTQFRIGMRTVTRV